MAIEIERKFLVKDTNFLKDLEGIKYSQGYIASTADPGVRIRVAGNRGYITLKSSIKGAKIRNEFEYEIPLNDAEEMLKLFCRKPLIEKYRYIVKYEGNIWEIDVFEGDNEGLVVAEVELDAEDQTVKLPVWVDYEVTGDMRYQNSQLAIDPYCKW
jgi:adenylate cyclase